VLFQVFIPFMSFNFNVLFPLNGLNKIFSFKTSMIKKYYKYLYSEPFYIEKLR